MNNLKIDLIKLYDNYEINNKTIFIFEGFPYDYLKNLSSKFFDKDYKDIFKINENYNAEYILSQVFERKHSNDKKFWMTAEEYSAVKSIDSLIIELFDFVVIKNNLFNKIYPYYNTMQNIKEMYEKFFYNVSDIIDEDDEKIYEVVSKFYGDIIYSSDSKKYYITHNSIYPDSFLVKYFYEDLDLINSIDDDYISEDGDLIIELSDNETTLLDFTLDLLDGDINNKNIAIIVMSNIEELPNRYLERISLLKNLFKTKLNIFFARKKLNICDQNKLKKYESLLKKYWGYDRFRDLDMYENIKSREKNL